MHRFVSDHRPYWLRNSQRKLSRSRLRNHHRNTFQRWPVDSEALAAYVDSEKVKETTTKGDTWILQRAQALLNQKLSTKTKSVPTGKSSTKPLSKVTRGFGRARSPCWLRKSQWKQSRCRLGNHHRNTFQRWRVDSEALAAPVDSEKVNETTSKGDVWIRQRAQPLLTEKQSMKTEPLPTPKSSPKSIPKVTRGFLSAHSPCWLRNSQQKLSCCSFIYHHRNSFQKTHVDSEALTAPVDIEIVNKNWVVADSEIITETPFKGDTWIRESSQPLLTQKKSTKTESVPTGKSSPKHFPKVMRGFGSACSPWWLRKDQRKWSRCRLTNHQWKTFHRWRMDSWEHTVPFDSEIVNEN